MGLLIGCAMIPVLGLLALVLLALFLDDPLSMSVAMAIVLLPLALIARAAYLDVRDRRAR